VRDSDFSQAEASQAPRPGEQESEQHVADIAVAGYVEESVLGRKGAADLSCSTDQEAAPSSGSCTAQGAAPAPAPSRSESPPATAELTGALQQQGARRMSLSEGSVTGSGTFEAARSARNARCCCL
jgi:hypothetical protein